MNLKPSKTNRKVVLHLIFIFDLVEIFQLSKDKSYGPIKVWTTLITEYSVCNRWYTHYHLL